MPVESASDRAVFFNADEHGLAASYFAPGNPAGVSCTIVVGDVDSAHPEFSGRAPIKGHLVQVRASEIAAPVAGGRFIIGGSSYVIVAAPSLEDPDGSIWTCMTA